MIEYISTIDAIGWSAFIIGIIATILVVHTHESTYEEDEYEAVSTPQRF